jgi:cobalt-precorrin-5B (C1)-methyltransferase
MAAWETAARALGASDIELEVIVFDREGRLLARAPFRKARDA